MYSQDLNVHCEICAYSRSCKTKELNGENNSVLHSLFSLPPSTYWWASSCILGNQWLERFHRVSAWLRVIWQIYELCWPGSKFPENNRHSARCDSSRNLSCFIILYRILNGLWSLNTDWMFDWITRLRVWLHTRITRVTRYCFKVSLPANKIQTSSLANRSRNISG